MSFIKLRRYQKECRDAFFKELRNGRKRHLIILPTGAGKTIVFAEITRRINQQTLILAHRDELIRQAWDKLKMVWPTADIGIVKAGLNDTNHQIIIGSTQTLANPNRRKALPPISFLILDEAHHGVAPTNREILNDLIRPETILLGVTATPNRADGKGLGEIFADNPFQGPDYERSILEMISEGYLCPIRGIKGNLQVELDKVAMNMGDYELSSLSKVMNTPPVNEAVVELWEDYAKDKKTLIFGVDVKHTETLTEYFRKKNYKAGYVHGGLNEKKRKQILNNFAEGEIQILINCSILTEGYDEPSIECIYIVRPTTSQALYTQMIGRGLRLYPGKKECLIIDAVKNTEKHNLVTITDLFPKKKEGTQRTASDRSQRGKEELFIGRAWFETQETQIYRSDYNWQPSVEGGFKLSLIGGYIHLRKTPNGWAPYYVPNHGQELLLYDYPLNIEYAMGIAENKIKELKLDKFAHKEAKWRKEKATFNQIEALKKWGVIPDKELTKGEADLLLAKLIDEKTLRLKKKQFKN